MPLVVGVDSSTQSTKVELRDLATGQVVGAGAAGHPITVPPRSEQDPADWWDALVAATATAFLMAGRGATPADVVAVAVAGQQHGLIVLDQHHQVLRPAKLWNDTESAGDAGLLVEQLGAAPWAHRCGSVPTAAFTVTKLAWLRRCEPETFALVARVLLPHDWLTYRLTGALVTDRGDASGTGYWSPAENSYRIDLLELVDDEVDWVAALPTVLGPWDQAGTLTGEAAGQLGLPPGTPVAAGTGDNMAGALGVGLRSGEVAVSIGTSGTVYARSDRPTQDPNGAVAGFADATGRFLPLVCTLNATMVTSAVGRVLGVDHDGLDHLALSAAPGSEGMVLVPFLAGERTPNRPDATGTLQGIRTEVSRGAVARAAFEGVVCSLLEGLDALTAVGVPIGDDRLVLVGGGSRSAAYRQVLASLAGRPVVVPGAEEIVAAGAALQAAVLVTGSTPAGIADAWGLRSGTTTEPGPEAATAGGIRQRYAEARG